MTTREIHLDPEAEQILNSISEFHGGNADQALSELLKTGKSLEDIVSEIEAANAGVLIRKRNRAEQQFASGDTVSFEEVKRRIGL
ncbi:MAG TPA: hypothetical protein VGL82_12055 [Bryobacteraceae bacterium]|jgi:hypothetical protein